jgi:hypothetical protein
MDYKMKMLMILITIKRPLQETDFTVAIQDLLCFGVA